jgi:hypothetical protein
MTLDIPLKTDGWDKDGDFNETWLFHMLNIGWQAETILEDLERGNTKQ